MSSSRSPQWEERSTLLFCPTAFEARHVRRISKVPRSCVIVTGPGSEAMRRAVRDAPDGNSAALLVGLAGGLDASAIAGAAFSITEVIAPDGRRMRPSWIGLPMTDSAIVISAKEVVRSPAAKRELGARFGASLVDLESFAFAEEAVRRRWRWGIIRAVSDDCATALPDDIETLIDAKGRTRIVRALLWTISNRRRMGELQRLAMNSHRALESVGRAVRATVGDGDDDNDAKQRSRSDFSPDRMSPR